MTIYAFMLYVLHRKDWTVSSSYVSLP